MSWNLKGSSRYQPDSTIINTPVPPKCAQCCPLRRFGLSVLFAVPARGTWYAGASDGGIIYGAGDGAGAGNTLRPVALRAPTLLSVLLWQPLSQQQRPSQAAVISLTFLTLPWWRSDSIATDTGRGARRLILPKII